MNVDLSTTERVAVIDVTADVGETIPGDVESGLRTVFVPHTTAGVVVNENESRLLSDVEEWVQQVAPRGGEYRHDAIDDNADAHLRAILLGESVTVPVTGVGITGTG
jgi:secondary thiamine-phosphate synthase enzyme